MFEACFNCCFRTFPEALENSLPPSTALAGVGHLDLHRITGSPQTIHHRGRGGWRTSHALGAGETSVFFMVKHWEKQRNKAIVSHFWAMKKIRQKSRYFKNVSFQHLVGAWGKQTQKGCVKSSCERATIVILVQSDACRHEVAPARASKIVDWWRSL